MHEFTVTKNILDIVEENAKRLNAALVYDIEVDIGELSGIDCDALEFAMQYSAKNAMLENAKLVINKIPAKARCNSCENEFRISDYYTACPLCGKFKHDIFQGREIKVRAIKVE